MEIASQINIAKTAIAIVANPILGTTIVLGERISNAHNPLISQYSTESILTDNPNDILLNSAQSERNNRYLIPDALALSVNIYKICGKGTNAYHTMSYSTKNSGWVFLEDYLAYPNAIDNISKEMKDFCLSIKHLPYNDEKSGLGSGVFFQYISSNLIRIAYVLSGTATRKDALTDIEHAFGPTPQYNISVKNAKILKSRIPAGGHLYFFGHSLGGGMANYNAMVTNCPAVTFNAASVNPDYIRNNEMNYNKLVKNRSMIGVYVEGEALSSKASYAVGLPKNGNRYRISLDEKNFEKKSNPFSRHLLEPLCTRYGLISINSGKLTIGNSPKIEI